MGRLQHIIMFRESNSTRSDVLSHFFEESDWSEILDDKLEYGRLANPESANVITARLGEQYHEISIDIVNLEGAVIGDAIIMYSRETGVKDIDAAVTYTDENNNLVLDCYSMRENSVVQETFRDI